MRPIKLTMSAFGPYADVEVIDFSLMKEHNIFLISGPTGAGKTTVFDGICYALFGYASGEGRDGESLRSHFAKEDVLTWVELEFELRENIYKVKRIPKQQKKKERGEGYTWQEPEAEFKAQDQRIITGIRNVNEKVISLLGINYEQFRQIVMIPQGEFRKLLLAESKDREVILRKIFGTRQFQMIIESLEEKARELKRAIEALWEKQNAYIKSIDVGNDENLRQLINREDLNINEIVTGLEALIEEDQKQETALEKVAESLSGHLENLQKELLEGIERNKKFEERKNAETHLKTLEGKKNIFEEKEILLQRGRKALTVKGAEDYLLNREKHLKTVEKELEDAKFKLVEALSGFEKAKGVLKEEEQKDNYRKKLQEKIISYKKDIEKVKAYEKAQKEIITVEKSFLEKKNEKDKNDKDIENLKIQLKRLSKEVDKAKSSAVEYAELAKQISEKEEHLKKLNKLKLEQDLLQSIRQMYVKKKAEYEESLKEYEKVNIKYEEMNNLFFKGQAGILAENLNNGEPCPVCGSTHHPKPAEKLLGIPTEDELKGAKKLWEELGEKTKKCYENFMDIKGRGEAQKDIVDKLSREIEGTLGQFETIKDNIKTLNEDLLSLKKRADAADGIRKKESILLDSLKKAEESLGEKEELSQKLEEEFRELFGKVQGLKSLLTKEERELPEDIREEKALKVQIDKFEEEYKNMEKSLKEALDSYRKGEINFARAETNKNLKENEIKTAKTEVEAAKSGFMSEVKRAGFEKLEDYFVSKLEQEKMDEMEREIKAYNEALRSAADRFAKAEIDVKGQSMADTEDIKKKIEGKKEEKNQAEMKIKKVFARLVHNKKLEVKIKNTANEIEKNESRYGVVGHLSNMAKGNNREKLSFERYVLAAYFDDIIDAANIRLSKMTDGRFELSRIEEKQKGAAQQGLEIQVYDYYTGQPRHVKVISGGESFKASLSLALGLSDVVQSNAGGISLDTIFIDEGFGSLDQESLEKAIQCLLDLQKTGKLVGVISHVQELKDRIRARIEIIPDMTGSKAKVIVI